MVVSKIVVFMEGLWASFNYARAYESPTYQVGQRSNAKQLSVLFLELFAEPVNSSNE